MPARGQNEPKNDTRTASNCPDAKDLINTDLFGVWVLELQSSTGAAFTTRLTLERNPEFAESLAGHFMQSNIRHEVFGDIEAGVLDWEESSNGKDIIAIWKGRVEGGSCGKAITGTRRWLAASPEARSAAPVEQNFVLRRSGW